MILRRTLAAERSACLPGTHSLAVLRRDDHGNRGIRRGGWLSALSRDGKNPLHALDRPSCTVPAGSRRGTSYPTSETTDTFLPCRSRRGGCAGPCGFRPRKVFLCHTCRVCSRSPPTVPPGRGRLRVQRAPLSSLMLIKSDLKAGSGSRRDSVEGVDPICSPDWHGPASTTPSGVSDCCSSQQAEQVHEFPFGTNVCTHFTRSALLPSLTMTLRPTLHEHSGQLAHVVGNRTTCRLGKISCDERTKAQFACEYDNFTSQRSVGDAVPLGRSRRYGSTMGDWKRASPRNRESIKKSIVVEPQRIHGSEQDMSSGLGIVSRIVMPP